MNILYIPDSNSDEIDEGIIEVLKNELHYDHVFKLEIDYSLINYFESHTRDYEADLERLGEEAFYQRDEDYIDSIHSLIKKTIEEKEINVIVTRGLGAFFLDRFGRTLRNEFSKGQLLFSRYVVMIEPRVPNVNMTHGFENYTELDYVGGEFAASHPSEWYGTYSFTTYSENRYRFFYDDKFKYLKFGPDPNCLFECSKEFYIKEHSLDLSRDAGEGKLLFTYPYTDVLSNGFGYEDWSMTPLDSLCRYERDGWKQLSNAGACFLALEAKNLGEKWNNLLERLLRLIELFKESEILANLETLLEKTLYAYLGDCGSMPGIDVFRNNPKLAELKKELIKETSKEIRRGDGDCSLRSFCDQICNALTANYLKLIRYILSPYYKAMGISDRSRRLEEKDYEELIRFCKNQLINYDDALFYWTIPNTIFLPELKTMEAVSQYGDAYYDELI